MANPVEILLIKILEGIGELIKSNKEPGRATGDLLLGQADHLYQPKRKENIYLSVPERLRHIYICGATGTGKSRMLEFLIRQDILAGRGFSLIDHHGDLYQNILSFLGGLVPLGDPQQVMSLVGQKLVLIDPTESQWIVGFNPLEAVGVDPFMQALEFMGIFKKLWSDAYWGPRMEELLRNTLVTLSVSGLTLLEAKTLLTDSVIRSHLLKNLPSGEIKEYWLYRYNQLSESMQVSYREPILNRLSVFVSNPIIRAMVGQAKSTINWRQIMDQGYWLLVNLSKGQLKSNASLMGALIVAKLQLTALSRIDVPEGKRSPFFMYIDEFQNFLSDDFETILSEARKYGLSLTVAHQNIDQLNRQLRAALLGNALTQVFFRLSHQDASALAVEMGQREKPIIQRRLVDLGVREAYFKKKGARPRRLTTCYVPRPTGSKEAIQAIKNISLSCFAKPRPEVEQEIEERLLAASSEKVAPARPGSPTDPYAGRFAPRQAYEEGHEW